MESFRLQNAIIHRYTNSSVLHVAGSNQEETQPLLSCQLLYYPFNLMPQANMEPTHVPYGVVNLRDIVRASATEKEGDPPLFPLRTRFP